MAALAHAGEHRCALKVVQAGRVGAGDDVGRHRRVFVGAQRIGHDVGHRRHRQADQLGLGVAVIVGECHREAVCAVVVGRGRVAPRARLSVNRGRAVAGRASDREVGAIGQAVSRIGGIEVTRDGRVFVSRFADVARDRGRVVDGGDRDVDYICDE